MKSLSLLLLAVLLPLGAHAVDPVNKTLFGGIAIKGYDPVAYHTEQKAVKGSRDHEWAWNGATWRFASAAHRDLFRADPEKYAPRFGGYCAWAVAHNDTANIDPTQWTLHEGKLYLNYNASIQRQWLEDKAGYIQAAEKNWPALRDK